VIWPRCRSKAPTIIRDLLELLPIRAAHVDAAEPRGSPTCHLLSQSASEASPKGSASWLAAGQKEGHEQRESAEYVRVELSRAWEGGVVRGHRYPAIPVGVRYRVYEIRIFAHRRTGN
jgi:hypothetical protein